MTAHASHTLRFLGAAGTVTGSRYLIDAGGQRILVDCGLFQGYKQLRERNWAEFPVAPASIDDGSTGNGAQLRSRSCL